MKEMINIALRSEFTFHKVYHNVEKMAEGQSIALGIADLNNTQGHVRFKNVCDKNGLKPIYGLTVTAVANVDARPPNPGQFGVEYILLAKNLPGLQELYRLVQTAYENFYYRPLVSLIDIWTLSENIIVVSDNFEIPERIDYFGLSVEADLNCLEFGLPIVALNKNYYPKATDKMAYELLMGQRFMDITTNPQHILSTKEWLVYHKGLLPKKDLKKAIENTHVVAEQCNVELKMADAVLYHGEETLHGLIEKGIKERNYEMTEEAKERIRTELELIEGKEFANYFLVVSQMTRAAKKKMLVGAGRGSAGGSLVCYLLGITEVDPLRFGLLFERFLDKFRHDAPDIDIDFPDKHREKVIKQLIKDNRGEEFVCKLGTVAKQRGDSLINNFGKELSIPYEDCEELKEVLIRRPGGDTRVNQCVMDTLKTTEVGKEFAAKYPAIWEAAKYEGHATHHGTHAAGILVCNDPVTDYVGVNAREGFAMIDYREAEQLNLLKIDALGLRTLTILQEVAELAGFDFKDYYEVDLDDPKAIEIFATGRLLGVFQFEGAALSGLCRQMRITNFSEIAAVTALGRPGPLHGGGTEKYITRQTGKVKVSYTSDHPAFKENARETYGVIVYQEQLMHICRDVGMSWKDTSMFRKVVAKRKGKELLGTYEQTFKDCAKKAGMSDEDAIAVWDEMVTFGEYGFNKSHAVAYAMISQNCAWAKAHYPFEFAVASLNNAKTEESAVRLLRDLIKHEKFSYIPVDADKSMIGWTAQDGVLVGGLTNIKGIGESKARKIIKNREEGKNDSPAIMRSLINPETPFDVLFPCEEFWGEYYHSPEEFGLKEAPSLIEDIQEKGHYTFIGKLTRKKVKDLNTDEQIKSRGGEIFKDDTVCLNVSFEDDTDVIQGRIPRHKFEELAVPIIQRDDFKLKEEAHWYIIKGSIISDEIRFIFINKIHYLGEAH